MKTILTSCITLFLCISDIKAQAETKSAYVSLHGGLIYVSSDSFSKVYNSRFGFIFGGGIGLPISTRLSLYAKAALFRKSGVPVIYNYKFENNNWILESETKDGSAEFRQWLFNFGLQYRILLSAEYLITIDGGINYTLISEDQKSSDGNIGVSQSNNKFLGFWGGIGVERSFDKSPFSLFAELQYDYIKQNIVFLNANYGGIVMNTGIRYNFKLSQQ